MGLYAAIAQYLQLHPPTAESSIMAQIPGHPVDKPPPPAAVPKGWKINEILPAHSAALTGGGISDNLMKDLMREEGMAPEPVAPKKKGKKK
jgi:signal recognition particle subunit SRP19